MVQGNGKAKKNNMSIKDRPKTSLKPSKVCKNFSFKKRSN